MFSRCRNTITKTVSTETTVVGNTVTVTVSTETAVVWNTVTVTVSTETAVVGNTVTVTVSTETTVVVNTVTETTDDNNSATRHPATRAQHRLPVHTASPCDTVFSHWIIRRGTTKVSVVKLAEKEV